MTTTRTHVYIHFADPYLTCDYCADGVVAWHDPDQCGCDGDTYNVPCEHRSGVTTACPSWGPVDGCQCPEHLGHVPHGPAPSSEGSVANEATEGDSHG